MRKTIKGLLCFSMLIALAFAFLTYSNAENLSTQLNLYIDDALKKKFNAEDNKAREKCRYLRGLITSIPSTISKNQFLNYGEIGAKYVKYSHQQIEKKEPVNLEIMYTALEFCIHLKNIAGKNAKGKINSLDQSGGGLSEMLFWMNGLSVQSKGAKELLDLIWKYTSSNNSPNPSDRKAAWEAIFEHIDYYSDNQEISTFLKQMYQTEKVDFVRLKAKDTIKLLGVNE